MAITLQDDMHDVFLNSGFEETVVYTPDGGTAKEISAIVYRGGIVDSGGKEKLRSDDIMISISTDATYGVETVTRNVDTVSLSRRVGETDRTYTVAGVVLHDAGEWRLRLA